MKLVHRIFVSLIFAAALGAPASAQQASPDPARFRIAVLPDTQNYMDYKRQRAEGFPFDARELFFDQMSFIARNSESAGGDIAFVSAVGDIWQHPSLAFDADHAAEGLKPDPTNSIVARYQPTKDGVAIELDAARQGFDIIAGVVPFAAVPGNHDYDAFWADSRFPASPDPANPGDNPTPRGMLHYGGLTNFNEVFGATTPFFRGQPWYIDHYNGGANSAQVFEAGGYTFLHIGLEMAPYDDVLTWASGVIGRHKGLPTIITIHDNLNPRGERKAIPAVDFKAVQAAHNSPEDVWEKFLSQHNQIFLVLSGHQLGQSSRVDAGKSGGLVWQVMSDYKERGQSARAFVPEGHKDGGTGDGWMRLMTFDMAGEVPEVRVQTYSTFFNAYSSELPLYAQWYRPREQPTMTDDAFLAADEFTIALEDFRTRFGAPRIGQ
jgi:hypothetical protein